MNLKKIKDSMFNLEAELNSLLAEEYEAWYAYYRVIPFLVGNERKNIADLFKENSDDELNDHANKLINRLSELGMQCYLTTPESWKEYVKASIPVTGVDVSSNLQVNLQAEQDAINHYTEVINALGNTDPVTVDMLKHILADEQKHFSDLQDFLNDLNS